MIATELPTQSKTCTACPERCRGECSRSIPNLKSPIGKPHYRRTQQVYAVLNSSSPEETYDRLVEYVRVQTGKGCSRKLISKWKKIVNGDQLSVSNKPIQNNEDEPPTGINKFPSLVVIPSQPVKTTLKTILENKQVEAEESQNLQSIFLDKNEHQSTSAVVLEPEFDRPENLLEKAEPTAKNSHSLPEKVSQVAKNTWSYVAATAIVCGIVGCSWLFSKDNSKAVIAQPTSIQSSEFKVQNTSSDGKTESIQNPKLVLSEVEVSKIQNQRVQNGLPRTIKIDLTLTSPQDLKVKPGDEVIPGTVLSDRTTERQRLLAQKKQLEPTFRTSNCINSDYEVRG